MTALKHTYPDGSVSYQIVQATTDELAALQAASDANAYVAAHATITDGPPVT